MDDLDRSIARRTAKNPRYPEMLQAEIRRQRLIAALIAERKADTSPSPMQRLMNAVLARYAESGQRAVR